MRYIRIFLLTLQEVFEQRVRSLVWFMLSCINPLLMILLWRGTSVSSQTYTFIISYFLFIMVGGSFLMSHSEESIATIDIQEGRLSTYLLKPFHYFTFKWLAELPYRFLQGSFGLITVVLCILLFHIHVITVGIDILKLFFILPIIIAGLFLAQLYKMCLGFISFWTTDAYGIFQFSEMLVFIFSGYIVPLSFYPHPVMVVSYLLPFAYIIYFPIASITGLFTINQLALILLGQITWICILSFIYKLLWNNGLKAFTAVGQ